MSENNVMVLGEKETFLIRVLMKKLKEAKIPGEFVPWSIDNINTNWEGTGLVTLFMDDGVRPNEKILQFLKDKLSEEDTKAVVIGESSDMKYVTDRLTIDHVYMSFSRPLDNEAYISTVREVLNKAAAGEFRKSILIVDDDPNYMGVVREWLKGTYKVAMANSGMQALKWLAKNKADLILLDHEMPVTSGPQVLEMLRSEEDSKDIPVMFLTGKSDKKSVMAVVDLKPEGYFLKSIEKDELLDKLDHFFRTH